MTQPDQKADIAAKDEFAEKVETVNKMAIPSTPLRVPSDLPDSIKKQLVGYSEIELQDQLVDCVNALGGFCNVDKIFMTLYYRHKREDVKRTKVMAVLNALAHEGRIQKQSSPRGYMPSSKS